MKRLDPILIMVILVPVLICGVTYFANKKRGADRGFFDGQRNVPVQTAVWSNQINTVTDSISHWWTTNSFIAAVTNTVYPEDKPLPACLTISITNHDIYVPFRDDANANCRIYLIRFTDSEWEWIDNHYKRYTNDMSNLNSRIVRFTFPAEVTNNPAKP